jgi:hypothetical protein
MHKGLNYYNFEIEILGVCKIHNYSFIGNHKVKEYYSRKFYNKIYNSSNPYDIMLLWIF